MSKKKIAVYLSLFALLFNSFLQPGVVLAEELTTSTEEPAGSNTSGTLEESTIPSADSSSLESSATTSSKIDTEDPVSYEGEVTNPRITYNANGGSNSGVVKNDQIALNGAYTVGTVGTGADQLNFTAPSPSKQIFDGWNTDPNGGGDSYSSGEVVDSWPYSTDTILYAQWATASTVSYNLNGATSQSTPASQFGKSGTTVTVPSIPTDLVMKENTSAAGTWTTNADGTGTEYSPGSSYTLTDSNTILYLKIVANPFDADATLTFNLDGGTTTDTDLTNGIKTNVSNDYKVSLPSATPTKTNYTFAGWSINNKTYAASSEVTLTYSTVAKALWTPIQYVLYENGLPSGSSDTVAGMPSNTQVPANGAKYTVPNNVPTRTSNDGSGTIYKFEYWRLDNTQNIAPGGQWSTNKQVATWHFVAIWSSFNPTSQWTVSLNSNSATGGAKPYEYTYVDKGKALIIPGRGSMVKSGFTFVGWSDGTTVYSAGDSYTPTGNITLTAEWMENSTQGTIKFITQSKSGSNPSAQTGTAGDQIKLPDIPVDNTPPQEGYVFWGWAKDKNATVPDYYAGKSYTLSTGITTLYGVWTGSLSEYWTQIKVNVDGADGSLPEGIKSNNFYELTSATDTHLFTVPTITKTGYTLTGWYYSKDAKTYQPGDTISLANIAETKNPGTLTAKWDPITYKITYDKGDATGGAVPTTDTITVNYNKSYTVLKNTNSLVKDGYTFIGWTDGTNIYTPGQNLSPTKDIVLKPAWKKNPSGGGGGGTIGNVNIMYVALESGVTGDLPDSVNVVGNYTTSYTVANPKSNFSYPGYTFSGWYLLDSTGQKIFYSPGSSFVVGNTNLIFYAAWTKEVPVPENSYKVEFNGNKNTSGLVPDSQYVLKGSSTKLPSSNTLVRDEFKDNNASTGTIETNPYIFVGWSKNKDAKANDSDVLPAGTSITPTSDEVYYAIWDLKVKDITLTYDGNGNTGGTPPASVTEKRYTEGKIDSSNQGSTLTKSVVVSGELTTYVFAGWNTKADGTGTDYYSGSLFNFPQDTTLYAKWVPIKSTSLARIIYLGNGQTSGDFIRYDDTSASSYTIKGAGNMAKSEHIFTGWNTKADGTGTSYNAGESITTSDHTSLVLYAQWEKAASGINVIYNGNGNTSGSLPDSFNGPKGSNVTLASSADVTALGLKKTGYMFAGWSKNIAGTGTQYVAGQSYTFNENTILYAIWAEDGNYIATPSEVTYHPNYNGVSDTYNVKGSVDSTATVDGTNILHGHKVVAQEINGGVYLGEDYTVASYSTTGLPNRTNYAFAGWSTDPKATKAMYSSEQVINMNTTSLDLYAVWVPGTYQIIFDKNAADATETMNNQTVSYDKDTNLNMNQYKRPGYSFTGWTTNSDGSGDTYEDKVSIKNLAEVDESITLYAQWSGNKENSILFDLNADNDPNATTDQKDILNLATGSNYDLSTDIKDASRTGYKFTGWYTDATGSTKMPASLVIPNGNTTYYAHWEAINYEVAFDKNASDAIGSMSNQAFAYDEQKELSENTFTRPGYTFTGWNTEAKGSGTTYADKAQVKNLLAKDGSTITLYAQWSGNESNNILFDLNANNDPNAATDQKNILNLATGSSYDLSTGIKDASRTGYKFTGWYTEATGSTKMPASLVIPNGNTTYYAHWEAINYEVAFDKNASDAIGSMSNQAFAYDEQKELSENTFTRPGYTFTGWNTEAKGSGTTYADKAQVKNLLAKDGSTITLYAQWSGNESNNILFDLNANNDPNATTDQKNILNLATGSSYDLSTGIKDASRTGYKFTGWYTEATGSTKMPASLVIPNGNTTYYAHWEAINYEVSFDKNASDAIGSMSNQAFAYDEQKELSENTFTRPGYTFTGWNTEAKGSGTSYTDKAQVKNLLAKDGSTITLYAQWLGNESNNILFDLNANNDPNAATDQKNILNLATGSSYDLSTGIKDANRTGYKFTGWYTEATGSTKMPASLVIPNGNTTYYAHWEAINYEVSFDKNASDAIGSMSNQAFAYDEQKELSENTFTRPGYTFTGWNTEAKGSGTSYTDKAQVKNLLAKDGSTITLYAQWSGNKENSILFDLNADNDPNATTDQKNIQNLATGSSYDLSTGIKDASRTGYKFTGWYTEATGSTKMPASLVIPNGNTTYYAHWEAINYEVSFDKNASDAIGSMSNQAFAYDEQKELSENTFTRPGYTFTGWNTEVKGSGTTYADKVQVKNLLDKDDSTITLYAQWSGNKENSILFSLNADNDPNATTEQENILNLATGSSYDLSTGIKGASRTGYKFTGWYTEATGSTKMPASLVIPNGNTTYYAHWEAINYEVAFDKNASDATGAMKNQKFIYDVSQDLSENEFKRAGYTFVGWSITPQTSSTPTYGNKQNVKNLTTKNDGLITLFAIWNANQNNIYFDPNGGATEQNTISQPTDAQVDLTNIKLATREGYNFEGWYTSKDGNEKMPDTVKMPSNDITYYAKWTAKQSNGLGSNNAINGGTNGTSGTTGKSLPRTGDNFSILSIFSGFIIVITSLIIFIRRKYKDQLEK